MHEAIIITPVKDSISSTLITIKAIFESDTKLRHIVYNDFSTAETKKILEDNRNYYQFELIHLEDITTNPYLKFKNEKSAFIETKRSLSFCCTLLSLDFLKAFSFMDLDATKHWYDTSISSKAVELGFKNFVLINTPVLHRPHGSRPWKQLKYSNPLKYYFQKFTKKRDRI